MGLSRRLVTLARRVAAAAERDATAGAEWELARSTRTVRRARAAILGAREEFFREAKELTPYLAVEVDDMLFFVATSDAKVGNRLFVKRTRKEMRVLEHALNVLERLGHGRPHGTFVDVGANIGTSSIHALRLGFSSAIALEPESANFGTLRINIAANRDEKRVRALGVAVSDGEGTADLQLSRGNSGAHWLSARGTASVRRGRALERVEVTTLDALAGRGDYDPADVGLLWMDVEGHELQVLRGATVLTARAVPVVMEFSPRNLARAGQLDTIVEVIAPHYTHLVDLHDEPTPLPATRIDELAARYRKDFTDVLLCRLDGAGGAAR